MSTKAERRAARERVSAYHQSQLAELLSHVGATIDRYRAGEIDAYAVDETIHHYRRAAGELWKFCFSRGGSTHAEFTAGVLDSMAAGAEAIDWWERATHHNDASDHDPCPVRLRTRRRYRTCHRPWPACRAANKRAPARRSGRLSLSGAPR